MYMHTHYRTTETVTFLVSTNPSPCNLQPMSMDKHAYTSICVELVWSFVFYSLQVFQSPNDDTC